MVRVPNQNQMVAMFWTMVMQAVVIYSTMMRYHRNRQLSRVPHNNWRADRELALHRMFSLSDRICHDQLSMKMGTFHRLCARLRTYGLADSRSVLVEEQVAIFLNTVGHDHRNRAQGFTFFRSGQTVSYYIHRVLNACLALYRDVVTNATSHNSPNDKSNVQDWCHYFQNAVGAIDGTHIAANVSLEEQARYCNRKQVISQNVLVACTFDMKFTYVLAGWDGSAHDGRLLRSAVLRQGPKLTVPLGKYYLADAGFPLVPGFLTPYRNTRYHRREIEGLLPENRKELFNFRHSSLRNIIERTIGLLKKRFAYLRHQPFHNIETQAEIVLACCALHNFLRIDDMDDLCNDDEASDDEINPPHVDVPEAAAVNANIIITSEVAWTNQRNTLANVMWDEFDPNNYAGADFD